MIILAIDTSCDDTSAAILEGDKILSNIVSSQTDLHKEWGGVVPDIAKRAHLERIKPVIATAIKRSRIYDLGFKNKTENKADQVERIINEGMRKIDVIAVTLGPGLAPALGVGVNYAKELALKYQKKLVAVNHIEGHLLSNLARNAAGKPEREMEFPALALTVSGGHTKIIYIKEIGVYETVGETLDDAAGEALDKAAKQLGLGYPGGPVIERIAKKGDETYMPLPRPMNAKKNLDFSFSGLKTAFYYRVKDMEKAVIDQNLENLAASYQKAVFDSLISKFGWAVEKYLPKTLLAAGGVLANDELRKRLRKLAKEKGLKIYFPAKKILNTDNAGMIGIAAYYKIMKNEFVEDIAALDRQPRLVL